MVSFYSNNFPREMGKYRQRRAESIQDIITFANQHNGFADLYVSLYGFSNWEFTEDRPDYSSAIIDRIYWDVDPEDKRNNIIHPDPALRTLALSEALRRDGIPHWLRATGAGLDVYGTTTDFKLPNERKKAVLYTIQNHYDKIGGEIFDEWNGTDFKSVFTDTLHGDTARITRINNTKNMKYTGEDSRYCVFISPYDLKRNRHITLMKRNTSSRQSYIRGDQPIDLQMWEKNAPEHINTRSVNMYEDGIELDVEFESDWWCVNQSMERCESSQRRGKKGTNRDRYILLTYLLNTGYTSQEARGICKQSFHPSVYNAMLEESQLKNIYSNGLDFPSIKTLDKENRCNRCGEC